MDNRRTGAFRERERKRLRENHGPFQAQQFPLGINICDSTCALGDLLWSDLTSLLYMQININMDTKKNLHVQRLPNQQLCPKS